MYTFDSNDLLNPFQHGFRSKHSCETQLVNFTQEIFDNLENGKQTDLIILNFSKAFDKVDNNLLSAVSDENHAGDSTWWSTKLDDFHFTER